MLTVAFPLDVFEPKRPDQHFLEEARAVTDLGGARVLIDHDELVGGDARAALRRVPEGEGDLVYRGWMVTPAAYGDLARAAEAKGYALRTSAEVFRRCHHLPGWYSAFEGLTPESYWTVGDDWSAVQGALGSLVEGPAVVKDYAKSEKHYWDEAMFIPDVTDPAHARRVVDRLRELRGGSFEGGLVVRRFEALEPGEVRTWWVDGECALITPHPDEPDFAPGHVDIGWLRAAVQAVESPFLTVDLARAQATGDWRVVEVGDGQVSDRSRSTNAEEFASATLVAG